MDEQPTTQELKAQAVMLLLTTMPPAATAAEVKSLANGLVYEIESRWKQHKKNQAAKTGPEIDAATKEAKDPTPPWRR